MSKKLAEILIFLGGCIIFFGAAITFCFKTDNGIEHIIYFRAVLSGSILIFLGSAKLINIGILKDISIAIAGGAIGLLIMSIINLINPKTDLTFYFYYTVLLISIALIFVIIKRSRLWYQTRFRILALFRRLLFRL